MIKKKCGVCKETKGVDQFRRDNSRPDGYQYRCTDCASARIKTLHATRYRTKVRDRTAARRKAHQSKLNEYRTKCCLCSETEKVCLDFHHRDPLQKTFTVCEDVNRRWDDIEAEIKKCVVICSNCHRKLHAGLVQLPNIAEVA